MMPSILVQYWWITFAGIQSNHCLLSDTITKEGFELLRGAWVSNIMSINLVVNISSPSHHPYLKWTSLKCPPHANTRNSQIIRENMINVRSGKHKKWFNSPCIHIDISPPTRHRWICSRCEFVVSWEAPDPTGRSNCYPTNHIRTLRNQRGCPSSGDIIILPAWAT